MVNLLKLGRSFLILVIKQETEGVQLTGLGKIGDEWKRFMGSFSLSTHKGLLI